MTRRFVTSLTIEATLVLGALFLSAWPASAMQEDLTYTVNADRVTIYPENMTVVLSTLHPAAVVFTEGNESEPGDGLVLSAILGYNSTEDGTLNLTAVPYHAPLDHATWTLIGPIEETDDELGHTVYVTIGGAGGCGGRASLTSFWTSGLAAIPAWPPRRPITNTWKSTANTHKGPWTFEVKLAP